jgi:uncharacterized glyoxalase superfamily protein PhnB
MKTKRFIRVNPHLPVSNLRQTLDYYRDKLGFYDEWTWTNDEGRITDGGIRRDEMRLLFAEDSEFVEVINSYQNARLPLMWFVDNIEEVFSEFQKRGIQIADTLKTHAYGLKEFSFVDINGYFIRVAERPENDKGTTHY